MPQSLLGSLPVCHQHISPASHIHPCINSGQRPRVNLFSHSYTYLSLLQMVEPMLCVPLIHTYLDPETDLFSNVKHEEVMALSNGQDLRAEGCEDTKQTHSK